VATIQIKLAAVEDKLSATEKQCSVANDKIQSLRHDYQIISYEKENLEGQLQFVPIRSAKRNSKTAQAA